MSGADKGLCDTENSSKAESTSLKSWEDWFKDMKTNEERCEGVEYFMRVHNIWRNGALEQVIDKVREEEQLQEGNISQEWRELSNINMIGTESNATEASFRNRSEISNHKLARKLAQYLRAAAVTKGSPIDQEGYIELDWILEKPEFYGITTDRVLEMLKTPAGTPFEYRTRTHAMQVRVHYEGAERGRYGCRMKIAPQDRKSVV